MEKEIIEDMDWQDDPAEHSSFSHCFDYSLRRIIIPTRLSVMTEKNEYVRKTCKISKKEGKNQAAGNKKVSTWLRNVTREEQEERIEESSKRMEKEIIEDMDWQDTPDPEVEIARECRKKEADLKKERTINRYIAKNVA